MNLDSVLSGITDFAALLVNPCIINLALHFICGCPKLRNYSGKALKSVLETFKGGKEKGHLRFSDFSRYSDKITMTERRDDMDYYYDLSVVEDLKKKIGGN